MNKKKRSKILIIIFSSLILILLVGSLGLVTRGFSNWNIKTWFNNNDEESRINEVVFDFHNASDLNLNFHNVRSNLNNYSSDSEVIRSIMFTAHPTIWLISNASLNSNGLNLGSSENNGFIYLNLKLEYTFNKVEIIGYNAYDLDIDTNLYSTSSGALMINYSDPFYFPTNELNHSLIPITGNFINSYDVPQSNLILSSLGNIIITEIHLFTELV
jgi:flagellar basal body-associated protein FliL